MNIFEKIDNTLVDMYNNNREIIFCRDINYEKVASLFPKFLEVSKNYINYPTRKFKIFDHIIVTNEIKVKQSKIVEDCFDHKLGILDIY